MPLRSQRHLRTYEGAPGPIRSVALSSAQNFVGNVKIDVISDGDARMRSLHVYRAPTGVALNKNTQAMIPVAIPSQFFNGQLTITPVPAGAWDLYVFPSNEVGIEGPGAAPITNVMVV